MCLEGLRVDFLLLLEETQRLLLISECSDWNIKEGQRCFQGTYLSFFISHSLSRSRNKKNMVP